MAGMVEKKLQELGIALPESRGRRWPITFRSCAAATSSRLRPDLPRRRRQARRQGAARRYGVSIEDGQKAARACAINLLAQVKAALGDLDKVMRVVRLGGFINSAPGVSPKGRR